jgi:Transglutaminase elicitor
MGSTLVVAAVVAFSAVGQIVSDDSRAKQDDAFQQWWGTDFEWKFDNLPEKGSVAEHRMPYSGYIYPDTAGGTVASLQKYDRAFNRGGFPATRHERWDTTAFQEPTRPQGRGFFGRAFGGGRMATPYWHGHCNGWTSATIRHAQPQNSVVRNGVTFTPADIKGLLAELYIYNEMNVLAGSETHLDAGTFHAIITNWIGLGQHSIGMEADPGKEKWNYPVYAYAASTGRISDRQVEVKMNLAHAKDSRGEHQESPLHKAQKYFHYSLNLDADGKIVGGHFYRDSARIDMLWIPLSPKESGKPGHERGNPYIKVDNILSIWRDSVPVDVRKQWFVIDQPKADRVTEIPEGVASLVPLQTFPEPVVEAQAPAPPEEDVATEETTVDTVVEETTTSDELTTTEPVAEADANESETAVEDLTEEVLTEA